MPVQRASDTAHLGTSGNRNQIWTVIYTDYIWQVDVNNTSIHSRSEFFILFTARQIFSTIFYCEHY
jgi:hypothetical protein